MRKTYFRIVLLPENQVLIEKDFDSEEEKEVIVISYHIEGVKIKQTFGYDTEEQRDEIFDSISIEQIKDIVESSLKMFK